MRLRRIVAVSAGLLATPAAVIVPAVAVVTPLVVAASAQAQARIPSDEEFKFRAEQLAQHWCKDETGLPKQYTIIPRHCITFDDGTWGANRTRKKADGWFSYTMWRAGVNKVEGYGKPGCKVINHWYQERRFEIRWCIRKHDPLTWGYCDEKYGRPGVIRIKRGPPPLIGYGGLKPVTITGKE